MQRVAHFLLVPINNCPPAWLLPLPLPAQVPPGRIYIKGLYVQDCPQLAAMGISVELGEAGRLSRDRDHAIGWKVRQGGKG